MRWYCGELARCFAKVPPGRLSDRLTRAMRARLSNSKEVGGSRFRLGGHVYGPSPAYFTYANAVHQILKRIGTTNTDGHAMVARGVLHGAMALYHARYLNAPPARIPGEGGDQLDDLPADVIRATLLDAFDRQRQVDLAARLVARHLALGHSPQALIATLAHAVLREDAGFHAYQMLEAGDQMLEAGVRQFTAWGESGEGRHIAAHSPTERAALQTADIAARLMRGGELHQDNGAS